MLKRFFRDLGILAAFCMLFWGFVSGINLLGKESGNVVESEVSAVRELADRSLARKDYQSAIEPLIEQTQQDEFNSHAWFRLGQCYWQLWKDAKQPYLATDAPPPSPEMLQQQTELAEKALKALHVAADYPRYRVSSLFMSAALNAQHNKFDKALSQLEATLEFKNEVRDYRFINSEYFNPIKYDPRFFEVKKAFERENRYYRARQYRREGDKLRSMIRDTRRRSRAKKPN